MTRREAWRDAGHGSGRDPERGERIRRALEAATLDALVCTLPSNVLLLSGYWPVVGTAWAVAGRSGSVVVIAPEDELELALASRADHVLTFRPASLEDLTPAVDRMRDALARGAALVAPDAERVGVEGGPWSMPASYAALYIYGPAILDPVGHAWPDVDVRTADELLVGLRTRKTRREVAAIGRSCRVTAVAFERGVRRLRPGVSECAAAERFRAPLSTVPLRAGARRAHGFAWCISGPRAATAFSAYARSTGAPMRAGELVLVHCNSTVDGYWTDVTRTYCLGEPDARQRAMYEAVFAARAAALDVARPGARAADVDRAARDELAARGFGDDFRHPTGHGVGFAAIDHGARPCLHPASADVLEPGMVCNVEPGIYLPGLCGMRHCDVIAIGDDGPRVLTPFHDSLEELTVA